VRLQQVDGVATVLTRLVVDGALAAAVVDALEIHLDDLAFVPRRGRVEPSGRDDGVVVEVDHAATPVPHTRRGAPQPGSSSS